MTEALRKAYLGALALMDTMGPRDLHSAATFACEDPAVVCDDANLRAYLANVHPNDALSKGLHLRLATWDSAAINGLWTDDTATNTEERRTAVIRRLKVDDETAILFRERFPVAGVEEPITIADQWDPWYTEAIRHEHGFYWNHYSRFLSERRGWTPEAVATLDVATDRVVERLSNPMREEAYQAKGLVVGYVQSGKTANFTGVLAKAIDVGYRLIIVLTGTTDLLRAQTQRRLDLELVGRENILRGIDSTDHVALDSADYQDDPDWIDDKFVRHGTRPSDAGYPDIHRLTTHRFDYKSLRQGIVALDFEKRERQRPFFHPENLFFSDTRLLIVKKNASVLGKLAKDLKKITARLGEIPALIVDDESDQASVNTSNPKKWKADQVERTAINRLISELLVMLPRAQYVGYTATPFANVFIDPSDAEDIFPKDFLISLTRTPGYMGASDFHDLDSKIEPSKRTYANSNKEAHVRELDPHESLDTELREAMDMYVLAGAIKVYRERQGLALFKHHTMLIHEAMKTGIHREQAEKIHSLWTSAGYFSTTSHGRLRALYEKDVLPVTQAIGDGMPAPETFEELLPHLGEAVSRIGRTGNPVIVVNSDKDIEQEDLDFDRNEVWRILVGGNKLARGFTVEGLTISYYRRLTKQADTLMQMGRWFGYRKNFRDLVRLYITPELYEAFEAIVLDEEHFRSELRRYAEIVDGRPQVTPKQIPPLVAQHLPWLKPAAANKMYNAILTERRSPGVGVEPTGYPDDKSSLLIKANTIAFLPVLQAAQQRVDLLTTETSRFSALVGAVSHAALLDVLGALSWVDSEHFAPDLRWLRSLNSDQIHDWIAILPQHTRSGEAQGVVLGNGPFSLHHRERRRPPFFGAISIPRHRIPAQRIAGVSESIGDPVADALARPHRGALLVYPLITGDLPSDDEASLGKIIMAFHLIAPQSAQTSDRKLVTFTTRDKKQQNAAIINSVNLK
ncbi:Z1 domain-containing protein [Streptosporangium sp. NPDC000563]|uniref:Z1 domain-containing protein n=1 Tax=Streptosporangium sp. NPDC000563 TaxID=3154366 RepID=UPI0033238FE0